jgi:NhaP-type Na+/H+ or K+/H+ antiporter
MWNPDANDGKGATEEFHLTLIEIMLVCSILVSSDIIAAMSILNFDEQPHIYSIIIGEGLFNDVVVIVLYQTVKEFQENEDKEMNVKSAFTIIGSFIELCILSVGVGVSMGFIITYILKRCRYVSHSSLQETFVILAFAMLTYYIAEIMGQSGITSLVSCALIMAHYTWYNLSPQGKHVTSVMFATLGYAAEAFVFSFVGLSFMYYYSYPFCWKLIVAEFFIVIIGRYAAISLSYYMFECVKGDKANYLSFPEISFLTYAALIRGAIAFGLVENLSEEHFHKKKVIVSTTYILVILSTIIFGGLTPIVQRFLLPA